MTRLIIARHGNTFTKDQTPTRVGARTDLSLVESGEEQAKKLGQYLKSHNIAPQFVYTSALKRTIETAQIACETAGLTPEYIKDPIFNEIDYGPDENKTEAEVIARIGEQAIKDWDSAAIPPEGWIVDPEQIKKSWVSFFQKAALVDGDVMVVTSNGIARFAPYILDDFDSFAKDHKIKLSTGALAIFDNEYKDREWKVKNWNVKP